MTSRPRPAHHAVAPNPPAPIAQRARPPSPRHPAPSPPKEDAHLATPAADPGRSKEEPISSHQAQRDAIREFVARTRAEQGLPRTIEDPTALDKIATVFRLVEDSKAGRDVGVTAQPSDESLI
jgi:hypothetical protein